MTEVNGMSAPAPSVDAVESGSPVANYAAAEASEKMLPQSQVDEIVKRAKAHAVEQYKKLNNLNMHNASMVILYQRTSIN